MADILEVIEAELNEQCPHVRTWIVYAADEIPRSLTVLTEAGQLVIMHRDGWLLVEAYRTDDRGAIRLGDRGNYDFWGHHRLELADPSFMDQLEELIDEVLF
jgi:hypothetical protein